MLMPASQAPTRPKAARPATQAERYAAIGDYAIIGDCRSAALVCRDGSIDWLCWPRFDSPSIFGALLDADGGGHFSVTPTGPHRSTRRYLENTNVLETTFSTEGGVVKLLDCMPVLSEADKRRELRPEHELLRIVEGVAGSVELEITCAPRPDYGRVQPRLRDRGRLGFSYESGTIVLSLHSDLPLTLSENFADVHGVVTVGEGERHPIALTLSDAEPAILPVLGTGADRKLAQSVDWWRSWIARCRYHGRWAEAVHRSALALKLMTFAPSGAVIAAPTTSLPEHIGGIRNWDYRYCWLRDASLTVQALYDLGYQAESEAFLSWLLHTTRMTRPELQILYDVYGESDLPERELDHLEGYAGSRPVRVGNAAHRQFQLDIYGEVVDAVYEFYRRGGRLDRETRRLLADFGETVCRRWREPDEGIWEIRSEPKHHTFSKAMCWVALDRLIQMRDVVPVPLEQFTRERDAIEHEIETRGFNPELGSYVSTLDGDDLDASLLLLSRLGYAKPGSPRMRQTLDAVNRRLSTDGLVYRYLGSGDGLPEGEGAFGVCSFWAVSCQALAGDLDGAIRRFEHLLGYANDVGLFGEEIQPGTGAALGNFPQAFTHIGVIDAALTLQECLDGQERKWAPTDPEAERLV